MKLNISYSKSLFGVLPRLTLALGTLARYPRRPSRPSLSLSLSLSDTVLVGPCWRRPVPESAGAGQSRRRVPLAKDDQGLPNHVLGHRSADTPSISDDSIATGGLCW